MSSDGENIDPPVGYRKPPVATRFKKGRSGNPRGRPRKKELRLKTLLWDALHSTGMVTIKGRKQRLSNAEIMFSVIMTKAQNGDTKAARLLVDLLKEYDF